MERARFPSRAFSKILLRPFRQNPCLAIGFSTSSIATLFLGSALWRIYYAVILLNPSLTFDENGKALPIYTSLLFRQEWWGEMFATFDNSSPAVGCMYLAVTGLALIYGILSRPLTIDSTPPPTFLDRSLWHIGIVFLAALFIVLAFSGITLRAQ